MQGGKTHALSSRWSTHVFFTMMAPTQAEFVLSNGNVEREEFWGYKQMVQAWNPGVGEVKKNLRKLVCKLREEFGKSWSKKQFFIFNFLKLFTFNLFLQTISLVCFQLCFATKLNLSQELGSNLVLQLFKFGVLIFFIQFKCLLLFLMPLNA